MGRQLQKREALGNFAFPILPFGLISAWRERVQLMNCPKRYSCECDLNSKVRVDNVHAMEKECQVNSPAIGLIGLIAAC